ncbi:MAG: ATP-binding cassette domain-containing protein [Luteitalea sp.]|nr:ATP-binding cassette domain-containing protein [Luteitalea sp.]
MTAPSDPNGPLLPWTLSFLRPHRSRVLLLMLLLVIQIGLGALQPWPLKIVIDYVLDERPLPPTIAAALAAVTGGNLRVLLVAFVLAGVLLQVINQVLTAYAMQLQVDTGQRMVYTLRYRLFQHLQSLGLHHHITTNTGDAVYRVDVDAYSIENLVMSGILPLATSIITLLVMFAILLRLDFTVALLALSVMPFLYMLLRYYMSTLSQREERVKELESNLIQRLYETFSSIRLVKSFAREPHEATRYAEAGDTTMRARIAVTWQQSVFGVLVGLTTVFGTASVLIVGGMHVMNGQMTVGDLTVVLSYLGAVYGPLSAIAHTTGQVQGAVAGARRVRAMLAIQPETLDPPDAIPATGIRGHVRFEDVGFTYPDGTAVLHDITFEVAPGQMIALVGLTGAGKTTLVSLIPRFYTPTSGRVLIDELDVRDYQIRPLREKIAIVLQDPVLFSGSIADNLRYGRLDATDAEIEEAARAAHAHEFIAHLPKKYDTLIAEAGGGLSGGERQRLSVARALLKNAPILILDEPTSSLDAISEEIVFSALRRLRSGRTTIVIAHRLSTVRDADAILVLDGGRIAAQGRHEDLLNTSQLYRRMCARLSVGKSLDEPETVDELIQAARP